MKTQKNVSVPVKPRWFVEVLSDTLQTALLEDSVNEHILSESLSVFCLDKNGTKIGDRPLTEIDEYLKNQIFTRRREKAFRFNLFAKMSQDDDVKLYFENVIVIKKPLFSFPVPRRGAKRKPVIFGISLQRRQSRETTKRIAKGVGPH